MGTIKKYWILGIAASLFVFALSIWLGALNQDEGWYLYAANLVGEGQLPYRDFFYTQGPLMPFVYAPFSFIWKIFGLVGARIFTSIIGIIGIVIASRLAGLLVPDEKASTARVCTFLLLGCNLYHVYYMAIPKTYALAALFIIIGFYLFARALLAQKTSIRYLLFSLSAFLFAASCSVRITLGLLLAVCGVVLLLNFKALRWSFLFFGLGGIVGLLVFFGPFIFDAVAFNGFCEAQKYHTMRGGFSFLFVIGSICRLVRWYMPIFVVLLLVIFCGLFKSYMSSSSFVARIMVTALLASFAMVFAVQMLAPFPYEDYQVPIMSLLTVASVCVFVVNHVDLKVSFVNKRAPLFCYCLCFIVSFGSPLLEDWACDGQDRFWTIKKQKTEIATLQEAASEIERLDPGGKEIFTQDLYLAIETNRRVPKGLEMGPFSMLSNDEWHELLKNTQCPIAAISGYTFAINPPVCSERPHEEREELLNILRSRYSLSSKIEAFGQNSTTLEIFSLGVSK